MWRIEDLQMQPVNPKTYGQFYGGDCYLVLYTYMRSGRPHYVLYMWQVSQSRAEGTVLCLLYKPKAEGSNCTQKSQPKHPEELRHPLHISFRYPKLSFVGSTDTDPKLASD